MASDHRPALVAGHVRDITAATERAANGILALNTESDLDVRRAIVKVRTRQIPDPTGRTITEVETTAERYAERLVVIVEQLTETATALNTGDPDQIAILADEVRGGTHGRRPFTHALRGCAHLAHQTSEQIHDRWADLHRNRWVLGPSGTTVLDEGIDADLTTWVGILRLHASDAVRLADACQPQRRPRQCACGCRKPLETGARRRLRAACQKRREREAGAA